MKKSPPEKETQTEAEAASPPEVEHWPLDRFIEYIRNPRKNDHAVDKAAAAIHEFGFRVPILAKSDGLIVDGHLRLKAAKKLNLETVPVMLVDDMTDAQVKAFRISVNKIADLADWDTELLALELEDLAGLDVDMGLLGFTEDELNALLTKGDGEGDGGRKASVLAALDVSIADPRHEVKPGDVWYLGERHVLLCECVLTGWPTWSKYLEEGAIFCPFPGPFVPLSMKAEETAFVMVQPNPYAAGHLLDRYADVHGEEAVTRADD
jgi:hypothetical protein